MLSYTTDKFRKLFETLPPQIQKQARIAYGQFKKDPYYPSLQFKRIHSTKPVYSARINIDYRAVGIIDENTIIWFWVGSHTDYEKLIQNL